MDSSRHGGCLATQGQTLASKAHVNEYNQTEKNRESTLHSKYVSNLDTVTVPVQVAA